MEEVITISKSEFLEIVRWNGDGGADCNVRYRVIPDPPPDSNRGKPGPNNNSGPCRDKSSPRSNSFLIKAA
jgi:hypothetical protein